MRDIKPKQVKLWFYRSCNCGLVFENVEQALAHKRANPEDYSIHKPYRERHSIHSKFNLELAEDLDIPRNLPEWKLEFGHYRKGQLLGTTQQISLIRSIVKSKIPSVRVRQGTGTASSWCEIWARKGEMFTPEEDQALKDLGLHPGGNSEGIDYQDQRYYLAKWLGIPIDHEMDTPKMEYD